MKDFIIIGNTNAVTYKEVFPLFKDNKVRLGYSTVKTFCTCNGTKDFGNVGWYSTLPVEKKILTLTQRYSPAKYPKYDNYDAIEVSRIKDIPYDYDGVMGVPVTIFNYNLSQFEIVGVANDCRRSEEWVIRGTPTYIDDKHKAFQGMVVGGKAAYSRVLIRKRNDK